ncbi:MAG: hypothetical protein R3E92_07610 [Burkholderiaceae bacterium]|nr:hypothetical protein [Rhodoferax sp.]MCP5262654.1 hypothetical protein [Rhodoferax sp.]MCW5629913.1 hypothetical protein [Rhodoferax sp.]MCW5641584.1 hypothetical protein [Rhodoferax sp.]
MINANARMEKATRGHIGQPAACMMENKGKIPALMVSPAIMAHPVAPADIGAWSLTTGRRGFTHRSCG